MERRRFIAASVALLVAPVASGAQQPVKVYRPGVLTPVRAAIFMTPFVDSPRDLGWIERRTFTLEYRLSGDTPGGADEAARDLVAQRVDMIVTLVTGNAVAAKRATNEIAYAGRGLRQARRDAQGASARMRRLALLWGYVPPFVHAGEDELALNEPKRGASILRIGVHIRETWRMGGR